MEGKTGGVAGDRWGDDWIAAFFFIPGPCFADFNWYIVADADDSLDNRHQHLEQGLFPEDKRGQFAGYYLFFWVMLPMILVPLTGGWLGTRFGIPTVHNGQSGFIPTPIIFQVAGIANLLAAIPLVLAKYLKNRN